jgi:hypothetical protein
MATPYHAPVSIVHPSELEGEFQNQGTMLKIIITNQ